MSTLPPDDWIVVLEYPEDPNDLEADTSAKNKYIIVKDLVGPVDPAVHDQISRHRYQGDAEYGGGGGEEYPQLLVDFGLVLGRGKNEIMINRFLSPVISKVHCAVNIADDGSLWLTELGSSHGTSITRRGNTTHLTAHIPSQLLNGDTITLGKIIMADDQVHQPLRLNVRFRNPFFGRIPPYEGDSEDFVSHEDIIRVRNLIGVIAATPLSSRPVSPVPITTTQSSGRFGVPESILYDSDNDEPLPRSSSASPIREVSHDNAPDFIQVGYEIDFPPRRADAQLPNPSSSSARQNYIEISDDEDEDDDHDHNGEEDVLPFPERVRASPSPPPGTWYSYSSESEEGMDDNDNEDRLEDHPIALSDSMLLSPASPQLDHLDAYAPRGTFGMDDGVQIGYISDLEFESKSDFNPESEGQVEVDELDEDGEGSELGYDQSGPLTESEEGEEGEEDEDYHFGQYAEEEEEEDIDEDDGFGDVEVESDVVKTREVSAEIEEEDAGEYEGEIMLASDEGGEAQSVPDSEVESSAGLRPDSDIGENEYGEEDYPEVSSPQSEPSYVYSPQPQSDEEDVDSDEPIIVLPVPPKLPFITQPRNFVYRDDNNPNGWPEGDDMLDWEDYQAELVQQDEADAKKDQVEGVATEDDDDDVPVEVENGEIGEGLNVLDESHVLPAQPIATVVETPSTVDAVFEAIPSPSQPIVEDLPVPAALSDDILPELPDDPKAYQSQIFKFLNGTGDLSNAYSKEEEIGNALHDNLSSEAARRRIAKRAKKNKKDKKKKSSSAGGQSIKEVGDKATRRTTLKDRQSRWSTTATINTGIATPIQHHPDFDYIPIPNAPGRYILPRSTSVERTHIIFDSDSSEGPVTPKFYQRPLKRSYDQADLEGEDTVEPMVYTPHDSDIPEISPETEVRKEEGVQVLRPSKRLRRIGSTLGLIVLGAALGSVGTIAGLMQMAE